MNSKRLALLFLLLITSLNAIAQYTEVINSNRPGISESPYSVGQNVYQFESNLFYRKAEALPTFSNPKSLGLNLQFRTSFFDERLEFNLNTALQNDTYAFTNIFETSYNKFNLGQLTLAAKYLVYRPNYKKKALEIRSWNKRHSFGWDRWIPHVGIYGGVNFGSVLGDYHKRGGITPKFGVLLQNELSNQLNIVTNVYYNYAWGYLPEWSYIITATYNFSFKWSGFAEHQALFNKQEKQSNLGLGIAYLFSNDLQFNSTVKATFHADHNIGLYAGLGASYRIDRHEDKYIELDEYGNPIHPIDKESYNKGFFGKLVDKIKGIFKKKDKTEVEIDEDIATPKTEDGKQAGRGRTRGKSVLGDITKDDKKDKKKKTKAEKKAAKKLQKEKEKALKDIEKEKEKAQREAEKAAEDEAKELEKIEEEKLKALYKQQQEDAKNEEDLEKEKLEEEKETEEESGTNTSGGILKTNVAKELEKGENEEKTKTLDDILKNEGENHKTNE